MGSAFSGFDEYLSSAPCYSFYFYSYGRLFLHVTQPYLRVNLWIDTLCIRCHKINSEEFNISGEKLVLPKGDKIMHGSPPLNFDCNYT